MHTILAEEYASTQHGTLHFRYLVDEEFGHVRVARTLEEHAAQLEQALNGGGAGDANGRELELGHPADRVQVRAGEQVGGVPAAPVERGEQGVRADVRRDLGAVCG